MSNISFVLLYVEDVARSASFYSRLLENPIAQASPTFAMLPAGPNLMLGLWRRDEIDPAAGAPGGGEVALTFETPADIDAAHRRWLAQDVRIAHPPRTMDFGYTFLATDPDGHRVRAFAPA